MGDVAMTIPVVKALAEQYPELRITMLSRPFAKPLFENIAPNVGFMGADVKNEYKHITGLNELYKRLSAKNFTAVADFHGVLRTEFLRSRFLLEGKKVAHINKHRKGRKQLCRQKNKQLIQQPSPFQNYADVLAKLGYPVTLDSNSLAFCLPKSEPNDIKIGIAPTAAYKGKSYPLEMMKEVTEKLSAKYPTAEFYVFGAKAEEYQVLAEESTFASRMHNVADMMRGFDKELPLMSQLRVMISMDSANMHLASLVGTPVVSIWGQTHPYAGFMGWGQSIDNAIQKDMPCRPCSAFGNKECIFGNYPCLTEISPDDIVAKVEQLI